MIKWFEWFRDKAYQDSAWVWTIWYWDTSINWRPVRKWDTITKEQAEAQLQNRIPQYQTFLSKIDVPLTENQKAALTSFEYSLWPWIWNSSAKPIITFINNWAFDQAAKYMQLFTKAWGKNIKWLAVRRAKEWNLLTNGYA